MNRNLVKFLYAILAIAVIFTVAVRLRLLNVPLERDEGEYAYAGQLILKGIPPYSHVYNMKLPGIYAIYAIILAGLGQSIQGIHLGLLIVTVINIFLFFLVCKKLFNPAIAAVASSIYAITGLNEYVYGFTANAEPFVLLFILPAIFVLIYAMEKQKIWQGFISGLLFGLAFLTKQHAFAFILFAGFYLLIETIKQKPFLLKRFVTFLSTFAAGIFLPYIFTCLLMWHLGIFQKFWFWTVDYAWQYVTYVPLDISIALFKMAIIPIITPTWPIVAFALIGLIAAVTLKPFSKRKYFLAGLLFFSFLSVCPGLYFRQHYFIFMLPAVSLLSALGFYAIYSLLQKTNSRFLPQAAVLALIFAVAWQIVSQRNYLLTMDCPSASKHCYNDSPFPEAVEIAKYVKAHTKTDDRIAVLGSEPEIYFYADRLSATGHIYTYPLLRKKSADFMQQQIIDEIKNNEPKYIVAVRMDSSGWFGGNDLAKKLINWYVSYVPNNYDLDAEADIIPFGKTYFVGGDQVDTYKLKSSTYILIFKRKEKIRSAG